MFEDLDLQAIGNDWFLYEPSFDTPSGQDYPAILAGEAGVKIESRVGLNRATSSPPNHHAGMRLHLTHLPLLGGRERVNSQPDKLTAPRLFMQEHNPAWWSELRPYQQETATWAAQRSGCIVAHDLGLGKTRTGLAAAGLPVLVLCPKSAISVWEDECAYAGLHCTTLEGRPPSYNEVVAFFAEHKRTTDVWLMNYHVAEQWVRYFCSRGPIQGIHTIICDEAHYLQKRNLSWTEAINGIARERCLLFTATAMRNRLRSLWSLLNTACPGAFGKEYEFRSEYCGAQEGGYGLVDGGAEWRASTRGREALVRLHLRLGEILHKLRRRDVMHEIVPLERSVHYVELPRDRLAKILDESAESIARLKGGAQTIAWYTDLRHRYGIEKVPAAVRLAAGMIYEWKRVVLWVWHDDVVNILKVALSQHLPDIPVDEILGKTSQAKRNRVAREWKAQKGDTVAELEPRILIASIGAASQAVSFTKAGLAIVVEEDWAVLSLQQLEARTHRFGNIHKSCQTVYCVLKGTLDETIAEVLLEKAQEAEDVLGEDGQVDQMSVLLGEAEVAERESGEVFMERVAARLLAGKQEA